MSELVFIAPPLRFISLPGRNDPNCFVSVGIDNDQNSILATHAQRYKALLVFRVTVFTGQSIWIKQNVLGFLKGNSLMVFGFATDFLESQMIFMILLYVQKYALSRIEISREQDHILLFSDDFVEVGERAFLWIEGK